MFSLRTQTRNPNKSLNIVIQCFDLSCWMELGKRSSYTESQSCKNQSKFFIKQPQREEKFTAVIRNEQEDRGRAS